MNFLTVAAMLRRCFDRRSITLEEFSESFALVRKEMCMLSSDERRKILRESNRRHIPTQLSTYQFQHVWILAHPSPEMFEAFLKDDDLCHTFTKFLWIVLTARKNKHVERKKLKATVVPTALELAGQYIKLLQRVHPNYCWFRKNSAFNNNRLITLHRTVSDEALREAVEAAELRFERRVKFLLQTVTPSVLTDNATLQYLFWKQRDIEEVLSKVTDRIVNDEEQRRTEVCITNSSLYPLETVISRLVRIMSRGGWPQFEFNNQEPEIQVSITHPEANEDVLRKKFVEILRIDELQKQLHYMRLVKDGLLSVGLKIHCLGSFPEKALALKGFFTLERSKGVLLLPPVGTAGVAISLVQELERYIGISIFDKPFEYVIQVCSPGKLTPDRAAVLGVVWYLGLSTLRRYRQADFETTHKSVGLRPILYGAGVCDLDFGYQNEAGVSTNLKDAISRPERTDVLSCFSTHDIHTINLVATLLVHHQYGGYWQGLGEYFISRLRTILQEHQLMGVLSLPWIQGDTSGGRGNADADFWLIFDELQNYAFVEQARIKKGGQRNGLLYQVDILLSLCRNKVEEG